MATVEVTFTPLPVHVRTARLVATAVARRSGVAESLLDEVRLAVGEACSRAVEAHLRHCPGQPIRVALTDDAEQFEVVVTDAVPDAEHGMPVGTVAANGSTAVPSAVPAGFGGGSVVIDEIKSTIDNKVSSKNCIKTVLVKSNKLVSPALFVLCFIEIADSTL
jgi:serine/threonine-protein kinase RsbW